MATHLDGVFLVSLACIPALKDTRDAIMNIASISGLRASSLRTAYGTSKAAVLHRTKQQAAELGRVWHPCDLRGSGAGADQTGHGGAFA